MKVEITTSEEFTGDIMGDLSHRRGRPQGMDTVNGNQVITAQVPMAEMLEYALKLRAMTQGRSSFHMEFSHYEEVPRLVEMIERNGADVVYGAAATEQHGAFRNVSSRLMKVVMKRALGADIAPMVSTFLSLIHI